MKASYKLKYLTAKKLYTISMIVIGVFLGWTVFTARYLFKAKTLIDQLRSEQYTMKWVMNEGCYEQFINNYDKALYIKMRLAE